MKEISTIDRSQMQILSLDVMVPSDSIVRVLDVFLDFAESTELGFKKEKQKTGRPSFPTRTLLGIYLYGYLHKIRSSRDLEKSCKVNVEVMWLVKGQHPCYKTISNFRKINKKGFRNLFIFYRDFCKELDLYGKDVVAIDGSKFRAQNSMKNNYNEKKIIRHLDYIETKVEEYIESLDEEDKMDAKENPDNHLKLQEFAERKLQYEALQKQLNESEATQLSTTDPDAKSLPLKMNIVEVSYNLQSAVDAKYNLIVDYQITNKSDFSALAPMSLSAKEALDLKSTDSITVLADKGYYSGEQIAKCHDHNIDTLVAPKSKTSKSKDPKVSKAKFIYEKTTDKYTCPKGINLHRQGKVYKRHDGIPFKRYVAHWTDCSKCPWVDICVSTGSQKASRGRMLNRSIYEDQMDENDKQVNLRKEEYRKRQAIVEHPFGTIKRQWGFNHTLMKTIPKVETEFSIIMLCYNLRRIMSILGLDGLKKALKVAFYHFFALSSLIVHQSTKKEIQFHHTQLSLS